MKKVPIICTMLLLAIFLSGCTIECKKDLDAQAEILKANGIDPISFGMYKSNGLFKAIGMRIKYGKPFGLRTEFLNLTNQEIIILPPAIGDLTELKTLRLGYNHLTSLPPEIGNLKKMYELDLTGNNLKYLPEEIGQCTTLTTLILAANELDTLPLALGNLTNLTKLEIWKNKLRWLPSTIGGLKNVRKLLLDYNLLTELPDGIVGMTAMNILNLDSNQFKTFPAICTTLVLKGNLEKLHIGSNPIDTNTIPAEIMYLTPHDYFNDCLDIGFYKEKDYWIQNTNKIMEMSGRKLYQKH